MNSHTLADRIVFERAAHEADLRTQAAVRAEKAAQQRIAELEADVARMREALTELVEFKKIKRRMEANSAHPRERLRYEQGKENAWSRAEAAIREGK